MRKWPGSDLKKNGTCAVETVIKKNTITLHTFSGCFLPKRLIIEFFPVTPTMEARKVYVALRSEPLPLHDPASTMARMCKNKFTFPKTL